MIDIENNVNLTREQRLSIIYRAQHSQPFFNLLQFDLGSGAKTNTQSYQAKVNVDKDYFVTEYAGNFSDVYDDVASFFDVKLYTELTNKSLWRFLSGQGMFSGQVLTDTRFQLAFTNPLFVDLQDEHFPYRVIAGDRIIAQLSKISATVRSLTAYLCLKGYYTKNQPYLAPNTLRGINESLDKPIRYEYWKQTVNFAGQRTIKFDNDRFTRVVLGFSIIDADAAQANMSTGTIDIVDSMRNVRFSNNPLPIGFLAPRMTCVRDTHIYYLPTEYLFEPFASLECKVNNALHGGTGYDLMMLTRTV
jgi:hypothetical protein